MRHWLTHIQLLNFQTEQEKDNPILHQFAMICSKVSGY